MTDLEDRIRAALADPRWELPGWPDPMRRIRRAAARQRAKLAAATCVVLAAVVVPLALLPGLITHSSRVKPSERVSATPVPCRPGWSVASGAVPAGDHQDQLVAIAGSASDDLWAVGNQNQFPLLEHWDGHRWAYSAGASLGGRQAYLTSVAAVASDDVWAVGNYASVGSVPPAPLIEHWNGRSWSLQPTDVLARLKKAALLQALISVAALAPNDVWVLGHNGSPSDIYLHWNGTSWKLLRGPNIWPHYGSAAMQVIATDRLGGLWAVGGWMRGNGEAGVPGGGIVEQWNGRRWEVNRIAAWREPLTMVAPVAPDDVWAIAGGSFTTAGTYGVSPVQVLHWNGSTWRVALAMGGATSVDPTGLVARSADDAYVIGLGTTPQQPFIDHWNGTRWRSVPLGPAGHTQRPGPNSNEVSPSLTVTADGSIAALDAVGGSDRANFLWLRCHH